MVRPMFQHITQREKSGWDKALDILHDYVNRPPAPKYLAQQQKVIYPFDVSLTTTSKLVSQFGNYFDKVYYLVVTIKDMGTASTIYLSFPAASSAIELSGNFSYWDYSAARDGFLDLTGLSAKTNVGTATIVASGVAY